MRKKLTSKVVEYLKVPGPKRMDVWDTVLQGFGVRVSPTGRKVWFAVVRVSERQRRLTIGSYPAVSLAEAREEARKIIRDAQLGVLEKTPETAVPTLGETVPLFIQLCAKPKNRGWKDAQRLLGAFQALFGSSLHEIKRSDVVRVLDVLIASGKTRSIRMASESSSNPCVALSSNRFSMETLRTRRATDSRKFDVIQLSRCGGLASAAARMRRLTAEQRSAIASRASRARWERVRAASRPGGPTARSTVNET
jgi:hypothetical protein